MGASTIDDGSMQGAISRINAWRDTRAMEVVDAQEDRCFFTAKGVGLPNAGTQRPADWASNQQQR